MANSGACTRRVQPARAGDEEGRELGMGWQAGGRRERSAGGRGATLRIADRKVKDIFRYGTRAIGVRSDLFEGLRVMEAEALAAQNNRERIPARMGVGQ